MTTSARWTFSSAALILLTLAGAPISLAAETPRIDTARVEALVSSRDTNAIKTLGPNVMPLLVQLYRAGDTRRRIAIAETLYSLGWQSAEAKNALMQDVHTRDETLRINVQYALGRVSSDPDVVDVLLANMVHDGNIVFRDKAACALAYDQIHLTERQKVRLYEGLIAALDDPKLDVRTIAITALQIQTGQTKGYEPNAWSWNRTTAIREWHKWLDEYRSRW